MAISDWSTTASSNGNSDANINWAEGQAPSTVNDSARSMMTRLKHWWNQLGGNITSGGSSNAYTLTSGESLSAYATGMRFLWKPNAAPTGAATMNVDSIGAKKLFMPDGTQVLSGELDANSFYDIVYDAALDTASGGFQIIGFEGESLTETHLLSTNNLSDVDSAGASLSNLGGQPLDATLTALAGLSVSNGDFIKATGTDTFTTDDLSAYAPIASPTFTSDVEVSGATPFFRLIDTSTASQSHRLAAENAGVALQLDENNVVGSEYFRIVLNGSTQIFQVTSTTLNGSGLAATFDTIAARIPDASVTTGTLTAAGNANRQARLTGNITMPASVFTQGDSGILMAGGAARTVTRGSGLAMYVNGSNVASATLSAFGVAGFIYYTNAAVFITGDVS